MGALVLPVLGVWLLSWLSSVFVVVVVGLRLRVLFGGVCSVRWRLLVACGCVVALSLCVGGGELLVVVVVVVVVVAWFLCVGSVCSSCVSVISFGYVELVCSSCVSVISFGNSVVASGGDAGVSEFCVSSSGSVGVVVVVGSWLCRVGSVPSSCVSVMLSGYRSWWLSASSVVCVMLGVCCVLVCGLLLSVRCFLCACGGVSVIGSCSWSCSS